MTDHYINKLLKNKNTLVICGPTASGKTALGAALARMYNGEVLSADSRQVYRGMDIGTGKDLEEYGTDVRYHLIDIAAPQEIYNLYKYIEDFYTIFREVTANHKTPVIVGGTGLYLEAVLRQYHVANVPENKQLRKSLMGKEISVLENELRTFPDIYRKTDLSSKKRIVRSLEIAEYSKTGEVEWGGQNPPDIRPLIICVYWPRHELLERINTRLHSRLETGMIEEVKNLLDRGITRERMMIFGLEYKYITLHLLHELSYDTMVEKLRTAIHRFSKRQMTWFRGMAKRGLDIKWAKRGDLAQLSDTFEPDN